MKKIFRTTFRLRQKDKEEAPALEDVVKVLHDWSVNHTTEESIGEAALLSATNYVPVIPQVDLNKIVDSIDKPKLKLTASSDEFSAGTIKTYRGSILHTINLKNQGVNKSYFGVSYQALAPIEGDFSYVTNIAAVNEISANGKDKLSLTIDVAYQANDGTPVPSVITPLLPKRLLDIIDGNFDMGSDMFGLSRNHFVFGKYSGVPPIDELVNMVFDETRILPIVLVSRDSDSNNLLVDISGLAERLNGMAVVATYNDYTDSFAFKNALGPTKSCFNGAIRIFWPYNQKNDGLVTRLILPNNIRETTPGYIYSVISESLIIREVGFDFEDLFGHSQELEKQKGEIEKKDLVIELKKHGDELSSLKELNELYESDNGRMSGDIKGLIIEKNSLKEEISGYRAKIFDLESKVEGLQEALRYSANNQGDVLDNPIMETVEDVAAYIQEQYGKKVIDILPRAMKQAEKSEFKDINLVFDALSWLATTYRGSKMGEVSVDLKLSSKELLKMEYAPHQSEITMGQFPDDYYAEWNRKRISLEEHLKKGTGRDSSENLRIAWYYDKDTATVVVGYIGQHQRNRKS